MRQPCSVALLSIMTRAVFRLQLLVLVYVNAPGSAGVTSYDTPPIIFLYQLQGDDAVHRSWHVWGSHHEAH